MTHLKELGILPIDVVGLFVAIASRMADGETRYGTWQFERDEDAVTVTDSHNIGASAYDILSTMPGAELDGDWVRYVAHDLTLRAVR